MDYIYEPYPKMLYHTDGQTCVVQDAAEEQALGPGWHEAPGPAPEPPDAAPAEAAAPPRRSRDADRA